MAGKPRGGGKAQQQAAAKPSEKGASAVRLEVHVPPPASSSSHHDDLGGTNPTVPMNGDGGYPQRLEPSCGTCAHYRELASLGSEGYGRCHRYPPTVIPGGRILNYEGLIGILPITPASSVCGEYSPATSPISHP
jgi:hypothetical protein